jgi:glutamine amidotransferase
MICIIDHGLGNFFSVESACRFLGYKTLITNNKNKISDCDKIILPGVGKFGEAITNLKNLGLIEFLNNEVLIKKKKILGICLGCQLLLNGSDESPGLDGLGWIKGHCKVFPNSKKFPSPHVGWNDVKIFKKIGNMINNEKMYFNHSFYPVVEDNSLVVATTSYSVDFTSIFIKNNIFGIQPHPEKSQINGIDFLKYFLEC